MLSRRQLFEAGLPLLDRIAQQLPNFIGDRDQDSSPWGRGLVVIGPTRSELEDFAPLLCNVLDQPSVEGEYFPRLHLPVEQPRQLADAVEAVWNGDVRGGAVIALPANLDLPQALPRKQRHILPQLLRQSSPGLVAASLLNVQLPRLVLLDERELSDAKYRQGLEHLCMRAWAWERLSSAERDRMMASLTAPDEVRRPKRRIDEWGMESRGLLPAFVWTTPAIAGNAGGASIALALTFSRGSFNWIGDDAGFGGYTEGVHLRHFTRPAVEEMLHGTHAIDAVVGRARGVLQRGDDDKFVPWYEVLNTAVWSPRRADVVGLRGLRRSRGYPLKRVDEICRRIEDCPSWVAGVQEPGTLYFIHQGLRAIRGSLAAPSPPKEPETGSEVRPWLVERYEEARDAYTRTALYRLTGCEDPEYLALALSDDAVRLDIRCRGMGSFRDPVISRQTLGETIVAWPDAQTRKRQVELLHRLPEEADGEETQSVLRELEGAVADLRTSIERHAECDSPYDVERHHTLLREERDLARKLLAAIAGAEKGASSRPQFPPAPVAIVDRRLTSADPRLRTTLLLKDLPEALLKYDLALLLSTLAALRGDGPAGVFAKLAGSKRNWRLTLGDWCQLNLHARRMVAESSKSSRLPELSPLLEATCSCTASTLDRLFANLVSLRNQEHGHGFTSTNPDGLLKSCESIWSELRPQLRYVDQFPLICVESRTATRDALTLKVRMLVHDNPVFALNDIRGDRGSALERLCDSEVYIQASDPAGYLSLHPWVLYCAGQDRAEPTVWLIDSVDANEVVYKSPFAPGDTYRTAATREQVRLLANI